MLTVLVVGGSAPIHELKCRCSSILVWIWYKPVWPFIRMLESNRPVLVHLDRFVSTKARPETEKSTDLMLTSNACSGMPTRERGVRSFQDLFGGVCGGVG